MKKVTPLLFFVLLGLHFVSAQKQANRWYFGLNAGLNFNSGVPVADTGSLSTTEGCSSIADSAGNKLFYTDGITVYNRIDSAMPNSGDLMGDVSATQSALIVPAPGNPTQYYVFTVPADGGSNGFRYSIVDMTLQGGLGDVSTKNVFVRSMVTEKLSAVSNHDGSGFWVMVHDWGSNAFCAFSLTSTGLNTTPVISNVGSVHSDSIIQDAYGYLKFSPDGKKVGVAIGYQAENELFDFDDSTGLVSNPITLPAADRNYGLEFSADNSKLYTTRYNVFYDMYYLDQYDLSSGVPATIIASQTTISNADVMRALQLGPDKKIYVAKAFYNTLAVINTPDSLGTACNFADNAVSLAGNSSALGLPGYVQSYFRGKPQAGFLTIDSELCAGNCITFTDLSKGSPTSWQWYFPGAVPSSSTLENPGQVCYPTAGTYAVSLITGNSGGYDTLIIPNYIQVDTSPPVSLSVNGDTFTVHNGVAYQWFLNGDSIPGATANTYIASAAGSYTVQVTASNGCVTLSNPVSISSVESVTANRLIKLYPVPASDYLIVALPGAENQQAKLTIQNVLGEQVITAENVFEKSQIQIPLSAIPPGYYILNCRVNEQSFTGAFIKQ